MQIFLSPSFLDFGHNEGVGIQRFMTMARSLLGLLILSAAAPGFPTASACQPEAIAEEVVVEQVATETTNVVRSEAERLSLLESVRPLIRSFLKRIVYARGGIDLRGNTPEDNLVDAEAKVYLALASWNPAHSKVSTYVHQIMSNWGADVARMNATRRKVHSASVDDWGPGGGSQWILGREPDPATGAIRSEEQKQVHEALSKIPPQFAAVIHLCAIEGLSQQAAAARLGIQRPLVQYRYRQGLNLLKQQLRERDFR